MILTVGPAGWNSASDLLVCGAPLRNRTVDLLLTMATPPRPGCTACTNGTPECSGSTACTQCARHPVHDSFHDQQPASGPNITLGDGVQVTLSERRTVTHGRARERAGQDARRPFRRAPTARSVSGLRRHARHPGLTEPVDLRAFRRAAWALAACGRTAAAGVGCSAWSAAARGHR